MIAALLLALVQIATTADDPAWSKAVPVRNGRQPVARFQARIDGDYLIVRAIHEEGWHTYAMDNEVRAEKALKGKQSLGIEQGIEIEIESGLKPAEQWRQTNPHDFSKPEMRWYTYGFSQTALFARRVATVTSEPIVLKVRGQACDGETCCRVDIVLEVEEHSAVERTPEQTERLRKMLNELVPVQPREPDSSPSK
ncbi:MAG: hypothetical protein R3C19_20350 [Planctomycetaceae bacterium]